MLMTAEAGLLPKAARAPILSDAEFREFQQMIYAEAGIHMPSSKKTLVAGRLNKRLTALQLSGFGEYWQHLLSNTAEKQVAIDLLTTNETYFFREPRHFDFLRRVIGCAGIHHNDFIARRPAA